MKPDKAFAKVVSVCVLSCPAAPLLLLVNLVIFIICDVMFVNAETGLNSGLVFCDTYLVRSVCVILFILYKS